MKSANTKRSRRRGATNRASLVAMMGIATAISPAALHAIEIGGFTEPNRSVEVASAEQGIVTDVFVRIGEAVSKGQAIASLDDDIHKIMRDTAHDRQAARGALDAARAELRMRRTRLEKLQDLVGKGFGRTEEVQRALADYEIAEAEVRAEQERLMEQSWQLAKIEAELRRRVVRAPMNGVVAARLKEPGEYVAPNEPNVITLVELDPLLAKFPMKRSLARHLVLGQAIDVRLDDGTAVPGHVEEISPVVDAQSGTIKVKVRIENEDHSVLSGERCSIDVTVMDEPTRERKPTREPDSGPTRKMVLYP